MRVLQSAGPGCRALEVGSYRGRSALFALAALPAGGRLIGVDAFIDAAGYAGHSAPDLARRVGDDRFTVIEATLAQAWDAVAAAPCDVALVDADHSFAGASADLALAVALLRAGGTLLVHDVADWFPGVVAAVGALVRAGVLAEFERVESLLCLRGGPPAAVADRPGGRPRRGAPVAARRGFDTARRPLGWRKGSDRLRGARGARHAQRVGSAEGR